MKGSFLGKKRIFILVVVAVIGLLFGYGVAQSLLSVL